ncbi:MAG TPA: galactose oxidase-like domain-containing protein [Gemmatimonadales bacterium]|nr:galactose oxidase-like domain-containing protein [Gemmatimonadales bacterium]
MISPRFRRHRAWVVSFLVAASALRCGGDNKVDPPEPSSIEAVAGSGQTGPVSQPLAEPLVVRVLDQSGDPISGVAVTWAAADGSVSAGSVPTAGNGTSSVQWVLGATAGTQTATATVSGLEGSPVTFTATAVDADSPFLAVTTQPSSTAASGAPLATQPVVQLRDAEGADVAQGGVSVTATIASGSGTLAGTATRATDANGRAAFTDLAITGAAGSYTLGFSAAGYADAVSTAIALTGSSTGNVLLITANPPVAALTGEVFDPSVQPVIEVKTGAGAPVPGVEVTAAIATGSGTLEGTTTATTDDGGVARFLDLGIAGTGSHTLAFTAGDGSVTSSTVELSALSQEATTGKWDPTIHNWDIVPLHMAMFPNGKIFGLGKRNSGSGSAADSMGMPRLWDPATGEPTGADELMVDTMLFCMGQALLPDGRLMTSGGHLQDDRGIAVTFFFGPDGSVQRGPDMAHGRWYPTLTVLPDERVLTMAGRDGDGDVVTTPEIFEGGAWVQLPGAGTLEIPYYPRNFVAPDGRVFMAGERRVSRWFDVDGSAAGGRGRWITGPTHIYGFNRDYGTAVMYDAGKILYAGGGGDTNWPTPDPRNANPTATAEKIDLTAGTPAWTSAGSMSVPRRHLNSTVLPDGQVLVTGGTSGAGFVNIDPGQAARNAEMWNPVTNQWTTLAANQTMRIYHSVSMLLPDGTVLHGASGDADAIQPGGGIVPVPPERNHEIFRPPYLFKGARPVIASAPAQVSYGQKFAVETPNVGQITGARWIRLGSVTHAFDFGQRANTLSFTPTATGIEITAPANANLAPPGDYQLFVLNRNGVPSAGKVIRIR